MDPRVSVIVRSYNRLAALCELLEILLKQNHDSFEIVVVEQSTEFEQVDFKRLTELAEDSRVRLLKYSPLGGPKARNTGVEGSRGELLIFVDDDDLPASNEWIARHENEYEDEWLVGFTGRHVIKENEQCPYLKSMRWFIRRACMSYSWLGTPYTFARFDEDIEDVEWLHGTNSSIRKQWAEKAGLWDTEVRSQDEHSFAFKLKPFLKNGYRLDFKKEPALIRRLDIKGGMGKRDFSALREFRNQHQYLTKVLFPYRPHLKIFYPVLLVWCVIKVLMQSEKSIFKGK